MVVVAHMFLVFGNCINLNDIIEITRMHSSEMRTARLSGHLFVGGGCLPWGCLRLRPVKTFLKVVNH